MIEFLQNINIEQNISQIAAMDAGSTLLLGFVLLVIITSILSTIASMINICPPNKILIFSGRSSKRPDGTTRGYRVLFGGRGIKIPIIETVHEMSLNTIVVPISISNAYSKGGIPLNVDTVANIKISSDRNKIGNAIERFLGRGEEEMQRVAKETLEGHLRGVLATLTPEEVNEDRLKFSDSLQQESAEDIEKLGLQLDTFKILHVTDEVEYLDSIGREAIANVIRDAEVAESDAKRAAEQAEAENKGRANVTQANVGAKIAQRRNELRKVQADLEAKVRSEEERTIAAAKEARAVAEQKLQQIRSELEKIRLSVDTVLPAEANREAQELRARGEAAEIRERGLAVSNALAELNKSWQEAGPNALQLAILEDIENILQAAANGVKKMNVQNLSVIDAGDGNALPNYMNSHLVMLDKVLEAVDKTTGIDIRKSLTSGEVNQ